MDLKVYKVNGAFVQCSNEQEAIGLSKYCDLANALQNLLENTRLMLATVWNFHWNIVGSDFRRLHLMFDDEKEKIYKDIDTTGEQIRHLKFFVDNISLQANPVIRNGKNQLTMYRDMLVKNLQLISSVNSEATKVNEIGVLDFCGEMARNRSNSLYFVNSLLSGNCDGNNENKCTASAVLGGFDKLRFKEMKDRPSFFKNIKDNLHLTSKQFSLINRGLRLAIKAIEKTHEEASIRYFFKRNDAGYIRVEINDEIFIIGYTVYESGKIKVWTRQLKRNIPVNNFDYSMLELIAKNKATKLPKGFLMTWLSI